VPEDTHHSAATDQVLRHLPERVTVAVAELPAPSVRGCWPWPWGPACRCSRPCSPRTWPGWSGPRAATSRSGPRSVMARAGPGDPGWPPGTGAPAPVRTADGSREVALPSYQAFAATDLLDQLAVKRMLAKLSSRRYRVGLEPVGSSVEQASSGTSRSAVSRRFVARTEHALAELLAQDLSGLDLVALMVDGIRVAEHCCRVLDLDGTREGNGTTER
jgi:putative transposase